MRWPRDGIELRGGLPLQILVVLDTLLVRGGEALDGVRMRIAERLRPRRPAAERRIVAEKMLVQRFEQGVVPECLAAMRAKGAERFSPRVSVHAG